VRLGDDWLSAKQFARGFAVAEHGDYARLSFCARSFHPSGARGYVPLRQVEPGYLLARNAGGMEQISNAERLLEPRLRSVHSDLHAA
jgi:hypothetical protein